MGTYLYSVTPKKIAITLADDSIVEASLAVNRCKPYWDVYDTATDTRRKTSPNYFSTYEKQVFRYYRQLFAAAERAGGNEYIIGTKLVEGACVYKFAQPRHYFLDDCDFDGHHFIGHLKKEAKIG